MKTRKFASEIYWPLQKVDFSKFRPLPYKFEEGTFFIADSFRVSCKLNINVGLNYLY